jgi:hypothetical protein
MRKVCEQCLNEFESRRSIIRFCSTSCSAKWRASNFPLPSSCFEKGAQSWNTGKRISGMSGKKHSQETKNKMRLASSGDKASNWKGGITEENYRIRRSGMYADWRKSVFERDGYTCVHCGAKSIVGRRVTLEADHILQFATHPDKRFDVDNGRTLCSGCHRKTETWGKQAILESTGQTFAEVTASGEQDGNSQP